MSRVYNFSAGPSQLPFDVLQKAAKELVEYNNSGQSVMEMSHRSSEYLDIVKLSETRLRRIMGIPNNYKVLFLQGGASLQFSMIPMNLLNKYHKAAIVNSGVWSKKAIKELKKLGECLVVASSEEDNFTYIPDIEEIPSDIDYFYICENNTIYGTKFQQIPNTGEVPLVCDQSSCILSEPIDVSKYGLIFAGAQKNLGIAGLSIVIIRDDLIVKNDKLPSMLSYQVQANEESMFNTPPTYAIYMLGLVLEWIESTYKNLDNMAQMNRKKAKLLYRAIDTSKLFRGTARKSDRSLMNVTFVSTSEEFDTKFIKEAKEQGLINLKGHRLVKGMRASIYNAMPIEGVEKLVAFIKKFDEENDDEKN